MIVASLVAIGYTAIIWQFGPLALFAAGVHIAAMMLARR